MIIMIIFMIVITIIVILTRKTQTNRFSLFESAICFSDAIEKSANKEESSEGDESPISCEDRNLEPSLVEMLDGVIMLYHIAVHKQLSKVEGRLSVNLTFFSDIL